MQYVTEPSPYDQSPDKMAPAALKKAFEIVMHQMPLRISRISDFLFLSGDVRISPNSSDEEINALPTLIARLGGLVQRTDEQIEADLVGARPHAVEMLRATSSRVALNAETDAMVFDASFLWGEVFRYRYPGAEWTYCSRPKSALYYGEPVLAVNGIRFQFCPDMNLYGQVGRRLLGQHDPWTPVKLMKIRAFRMGIGPEPGPADQRDPPM